MVAQFNGKPTAKKEPAPTGQPVAQKAKKIESPASKAKATGGSAFAGSNGQFKR